MFRVKDRDKCERLFEKYYGGHKFHDGFYREAIAKHLRPGERLLDAGCGRYMRFCKELSSTAHVVGLDYDEQFETDNRRAPFAVRGDLHRLPFPSGSFDVIISRSVVEHLDKPAQVFREWARVLRPGGRIIVITPNKWDYVSLIAAVTPYRFHRALVSRLFSVSADDVFPTLYRANTAGRLRGALKAAEFQELDLRLINHYPAYLMFSPVLFRLGVLYERMTSLHMFRHLRGTLLAVFEKPRQEQAGLLAGRGRSGGAAIAEVKV